MANVNDLILGQVVYGEKAIFSLTVDNSVIKTLNDRFSFQWNLMNQPSLLVDSILDDVQLQNAVKNQPELVNYSIQNTQSILVFSSVRELVVREKIPRQHLRNTSSLMKLLQSEKKSDNVLMSVY